VTSVVGGNTRATIATDGGVGITPGGSQPPAGSPAEYPTNAATAMTHITIHETLDGKVVDRMEGGEEVGDEQ